ncbi:SIS domain-containing protein [Roseibium sp.]|uniref:SIS domain-containing protein n=1 Tax=Roseibium sp. TaxID=1936156 RepID=UPI003B52A224
MPSDQSTQMATEIAEIPAMIERQLTEGLEQYWQTGARWRTINLHGFVTCARGTSDHAATFFKYMMETATGRPVASIGPSVASIHDTKLKLDGFVSLAFSQSGGSPDLVALQKAAAKGGADTVAILNETQSPLGATSRTVLPVLAGPERAVAATKSFVGMLVASLCLVAGYTNDVDLKMSLGSLPDLTRLALESNWSHAVAPVARANSIYCLGRGTSLAVAAEAALKLKETCRIHAEAYSAAELLHGPIVIADRKLAVLSFDSGMAASASAHVAETRLVKNGASVFSVNGHHGNLPLNLPDGVTEPVLPILQAVAFYSFVETLSCLLGENPDAPEGLLKVTETV